MTSQMDFVGATFADTMVSGDGDASGFADIALENQRRAVIAFVGLAFEARIAAGPGVLVVCRTAGGKLATMAENAVRQGYRGMISFGVAGGLASHLRAGDWVVASAVRESHLVRATDAVWSRKLLNLIAGAVHAPVLGVDAPVADPARKRELYRATGAAACDMESHVVARTAAAYGLAFAAVRVIVDPAHRVIPPAALLGMRPNGRADKSAVLRDLMVRPSQIARLTRIALDAYVARAEMLRVRRVLGPHFGLSITAEERAIDRSAAYCQPRGNNRPIPAR